MDTETLAGEHAINPPAAALDNPPKRGRGRPRTITLELVEQVGNLIARGLTEEQACLRVGINHCSFRTARSRNPEFETAIKLAQAAFLDQATDSIAKGGRGWQGLAWLLERRHGDQFRRTNGLEVSGHIAAFNPVDALLKKPLAHWTAADIDHSVGAWKLLREWPKERLAELNELYVRCWGPQTNQWSDEQILWHLEVDRAITGNSALLDALQSEDPSAHPELRNLMARRLGPA